MKNIIMLMHLQIIIGRRLPTVHERSLQKYTSLIISGLFTLTKKD